MKIFIPYDPINWNEYIKIERSNKYGANNVKQKEKKIVRAYAKESYQGSYPVEIIFRAHFNAYRKDLDNTRVKGLLDGLVACNVIKNDNLKHVQRITIEPIFDNVKGIEIEIKELEK